MAEVQERDRAGVIDPFADREAAPLVRQDAPVTEKRVTGQVVSQRTEAQPQSASRVYFTEQVGDLVAALAKAQGQFGKIEKELEANVKAKNSDAKFDITWADLSMFFEAVRPALSAVGIFYAQFPEFVQHGVRVQTILFKGEQRIWNYMFMPYGSGGNDAWTVASATTYAKRYGFAALLGIAAEHDDDGARASGRDTSARREAPPPAQRKSETEKAEKSTSKPAAKPAAKAAAKPANPEIKNDRGTVVDYRYREQQELALAKLSTGQVVYTKNPEWALKLEQCHGTDVEVVVTSRQMPEDQQGIRQIIGLNSVTANGATSS